MEEFKNLAYKLFYEYKGNKLPDVSLRKQLTESGYLETVYDDFRSELVTIKNSIVSSADEAQECNILIDELAQKLKEVVEESL